MTQTRTIDELYSLALPRDEGTPIAQPFAYQRAVARDGLPQLLDVPTGCGKTPALLLGWLHRRRFHPDSQVRSATPRRLIWCAPLRSLTEQTSAVARHVVDALGLADEVQVHTLMGGHEVSRDWRLDLDKDTILICTLDMALSRALNRGYKASPHSWPIDFAIFNNDAHWVFDEVQLMGPALATSRQLQGLRASLGVALETSTTWMSATVDVERFHTVDAPEIAIQMRLSDFDDDPLLTSRLQASKSLRCRSVGDSKNYAADLADLVLSEHREGTLTLVVVNTVELARDVFKRVTKSAADPVVLLHSRFRPGDRQIAFGRAVAPATPGRIVVSTQVIEAGVDMSATTLITEAAPWSSIVQRAGRCNRWAEVDGAQMIVVEQSGKGPYEDDDVESSWLACTELDGSLVTPQSLAAASVSESAPVSPVLRLQDLLDLFDTAPDLSGNSIDIGQFIRDGDDLDVSIAWRQLDETGPSADNRSPSRDELCSASIHATRELLRHPSATGWTFDLHSSAWKRVDQADLRPGLIIVMPTTSGGYDSELGFDPKSRGEVEPMPTSEPTLDSLPSDDQGTGDDPLSIGIGRTVTLSEHLLDTEGAAASLCRQIGMTPNDTSAVVRSARLHDLGKAHHVWQTAVRAAAGDDSAVLAKSGANGRLNYERPGFRHELASALTVLDQPDLAGDSDPDLVAYLVASHHGRVRQTMRGTARDAPNRILGVEDGESLPVVDLGDGWATAAATLSLETARLGQSPSGVPSWSNRVLGLLDEYGPFRLAWLETLVRIADWRASIDEGRPQ